MKKVILWMMCVCLFFSCSQKKEDKVVSIAVFVPGVRKESPIYSMLCDGVEKAVAQSEKKVRLSIIEAGTNQAVWKNQLMGLAADGAYDLIITSNPSMPDLAQAVIAAFPTQRFLIFDAFAANPKGMSTFQYNQREQAYLAGHIAALVSSSSMPFANKQKKIGLIAGQEYPAMMKVIAPAFLEGARAVDPEFSLDFRVVGNWYDGAKGAELATAMFKDGVDVIMPICGGANLGVLSAAKDNGFYVAWFDSNGYAKAPGYVVASSALEQEKLAEEKTRAFLNGTLAENTATTLGLRDGYVQFIQDDPVYQKTVPEDIRNKQSQVVEAITQGTLDLPSNE